MYARCLIFLVLAVAGLHAPLAVAVEALSASSLGAMCKSFDPLRVDTSSCEQYVLGFVDGAVATAVRVMLNVEAEQKKETLTERATRTRLGMSDARRAAGYAEFCLGDPVPLREVVVKVAADLSLKNERFDDGMLARDLVYESLRRHFPCSS